MVTIFNGAVCLSHTFALCIICIFAFCRKYSQHLSIASLTSGELVERERCQNVEIFSSVYTSLSLGELLLWEFFQSFRHKLEFVPQSHVSTRHHYKFQTISSQLAVNSIACLCNYIDPTEPSITINHKKTYMGLCNMPYIDKNYQRRLKLFAKTAK